MSNWLDTTNANRLKQSYLNGFLDISGNLTLRNGTAFMNTMQLQTYDSYNFDTIFGNLWMNTNINTPYLWQNICVSATGKFQIAIQRNFINTDTKGNIFISNNYGVVNSWIDTNKNSSILPTYNCKFQDISISKNGQYITIICKPVNNANIGNSSFILNSATANFFSS